jgi:hypothetical protein
MSKLDQIRALREARQSSDGSGKPRRENLADESEALTKESHPFVTSVHASSDVALGPSRIVPALIGTSGVAPRPSEASTEKKNKKMKLDTTFDRQAYQRTYMKEYMKQWRAKKITKKI